MQEDGLLFEQNILVHVNLHAGFLFQIGNIPVSQIQSRFNLRLCGHKERWVEGAQKLKTVLEQA